MERKIEKVIMLYQHSSNPINYWADMSKYKDKAENMSGCSLMEKGWKMTSEGVARKGSGTNSWCKEASRNEHWRVLFIYLFLPRLAMIKVTDVDKYLHSQFISSCLARGCRQQNPRLITPEAWGMMLRGGGGAEDDDAAAAAAGSWPTCNPKVASWYLASPQVVKQGSLSMCLLHSRKLNCWLEFSCTLTVI